MSLANAPITVTLTASDVARAKAFYSEKLGLKEIETSEEDGVFFEAGAGTKLYIYNSGAPKATNTVAGFKVDDVLATVNELKAKGVVFESYDFPGLKTDENNIARMGDFQFAWFKDSEGNILAVGNE